MSLDLDRRQRAMLQEMGVRVWWPEAAADRPTEPLLPIPTRTAPALKTLTVDVTTRPVQVNKNLMSEPAPKVVISVGVLPEGIAAMDWPMLGRTIADCQACQLCSGRRAAVFGATDVPHQADWLVVGEPPDEAEERSGQPFAGPAGQLLDNMLKAVGASRHGNALARSAAAYVTNVVKCRPATPRNPTPQELASCEHYLRREVALVQPKIILALGRLAAQTLLQGSVPELASIPLGQLRGQIQRYQGIPVLVTYHPNYLLRSPQHKGRAWADLCLALSLRHDAPS